MPSHQPSCPASCCRGFDRQGSLRLGLSETVLVDIRNVTRYIEP